MTQDRQAIDGRTFAIGVLSVTACILLVGFLLVTTTRPVHAIGENDSAGDYKIATQQLSTSTEGIVVVDAAARRLIIYGFDFGRKQLMPLSTFELNQLQAPGPGEGKAGARRPGG